MEKDRLKSCPFCGAAAILAEDRWGAKVRCPVCAASIYVQKMYGKGKEHNEREKAIKSWNRRTPKFE